MKKIISKIPGFRSGKWWKKAIAIPSYASVGLIGIGILIPTGPIITTDTEINSPSEQVIVLGTSDENAPYQLLAEDRIVQEGIVNNDGKFEIDVKDLKEGENYFTLRICDPEDLETCTEKEIIIVYASPTAEPIATSSPSMTHVTTEAPTATTRRTTAPTKIPTPTLRQHPPTSTPVPQVQYTAPQVNGGSTQGGGGGYSGGDRDCGDFSTHVEAQAFFISQGGPGNDPHDLDRDSDGSACETLP